MFSFFLLSFFHHVLIRSFVWNSRWFIFFIFSSCWTAWCFRLISLISSPFLAHRPDPMSPVKGHQSALLEAPCSSSSFAIFCCPWWISFSSLPPPWGINPICLSSWNRKKWIQPTYIHKHSRLHGVMVNIRGSDSRAPSSILGEASFNFFFFGLSVRTLLLVWYPRKGTQSAQAAFLLSCFFLVHQKWRKILRCFPSPPISGTQLGQLAANFVACVTPFSRWRKTSTIFLIPLIMLSCKRANLPKTPKPLGAPSICVA